MQVFSLDFKKHASQGLEKAENWKKKIVRNEILKISLGSQQTCRHSYSKLFIRNIIISDVFRRNGNAAMEQRRDIRFLSSLF